MLLGLMFLSFFCFRPKPKDLKSKRDASLLKDIKKIKPSSDCRKCVTLNKDVQWLRMEVEVLKKEAIAKEEKLAHLKEKAKKYKQKYRAAKEEVQTASYREPESVKEIGPNVRVPEEKLALCRGTDSSKYTEDLMEVILGGDVLAEEEAKQVF
ncbi:hypothetical protein JTE90_028792 [Oedothorax gibbosus]|uniref:Uncharacterized protein n=1 Tax=Oedothorax gibbosus TaxID=931172 RepID=A0AAV6VWY2_9ARAC|nr:hypothetical protein JTE90_028792 [Oedothorax gibbosus]